MALVVSSFGMMCLIHFAGSNLLFRHLGSSIKRSTAGRHFVGLVHALVASIGAIRILLSPEGQSLRPDLYAETMETTQLHSFSLGFFLFDVAHLFVFKPLFEEGAKPDPAFVAHGAACSLVFTFGLRAHFCHHMGAVMLLNEMSSVPFNLRKLMILHQRGYGPLFKAVQLSFGLLFIGVRLGVMPVFSFLWCLDAYEYFREGRLHSNAEAMFFFTMNILLTGLNVIWAHIIVTTAIRGEQGGATNKQKAI